MDIQALRKMRNQDFSKIAGEFDKIANPDSAGGKSYKDDRVWKLEPDKAGNATAVIRFLPRSEGDELPWVRVFNHSFQGPTGKWYIENSLTTLGENDPVGELNSRLWNSGSEANKEIARKQKRKAFLDAEFLCIGRVVSDEGKCKGKLGALVFVTNKGVRFEVGTGFTDEEREEYIKEDYDFRKKATIKYLNLTDDGRPFNASFVGWREDV